MAAKFRKNPSKTIEIISQFVLSVSEIGELTGLGPTALHHRHRNGQLTYDKGENGLCAPLGRAIYELINAMKLSGRDGTLGEPINAKTDGAFWKSRMLALDYEQRIGTLIPLDEVYRLCATVFKEFVGALDRLVDSIENDESIPVSAAVLAKKLIHFERRRCVERLKEMEDTKPIDFDFDPHLPKEEKPAEKRKRGRKLGSTNKPRVKNIQSQTIPPPKRGRGRPRKTEI